MKVKLKKVSLHGEEPIEIQTEYIKLDSFLKFAMVTETGGDAKSMILDGEVKVNGETCTQRGKKLHSGDTVEAENKKYLVIRKIQNAD